MGALPKQRVSRGRQGRRRAHHHVQLPTLDTCPNCRAKKVAHHACQNCGFYHGRLVSGIIRERIVDDEETEA